MSRGWNTTSALKHCMRSKLCCPSCNKIPNSSLTSNRTRMAAEYASFGGWSRNLKLSNDSVELVLTLEVGPRIISFRPLNGRNIFKVVAAQSGKSNESDWKIRGGHRLWTAPEDFDRVTDGRSLTYVIDNSSVEHEIQGEYTVRVSHKMDHPEKIYREMVVTLEAHGAGVKVEHRITNQGDGPLEFA